MDFWLQFAIAILKGVLAGLHADPNKAQALKKVLIGVAGDIYILYDMVPPLPLPVPVQTPGLSSAPSIAPAAIKASALS